MEFITLTAKQNDDGRRLDRILKNILTEGNSPYSLLRKGLVKVNDKKAEASQKINAGDTIRIASFLLEKTQPEAQEKNIPSFNLETIFQNEHFLIINKPYGIPVQPSSKQDISLSEIVRQKEEKSDGTEKSLSFRTGPLHRLDRNTTGLLVFSRSLSGARWFSSLIQESTEKHSDSFIEHSLYKPVQKTYIGVAEGNLTERVTWNDTITENGSDGNGFYRMKVTAAGKGQSAVTEAIPLAKGSYRGKTVTLVQFNIYTGRKHQIRCSSSFHGFPLAGDTVYKGTPIHSQREFYLHAVHLKFPYPNDFGLPPDLTAPLQEDFIKFLNDCLINWNGSLILE